MIRASKTVSLLIVLVFAASPFGALAQTVPIQDTYKTVRDESGLTGLPECPPALDDPVSGKNLEGLTDNFRPDDIDLDGKSNVDELSQGSDPTWNQSMPKDRDADGVGESIDPCDFDPRLPTSRIDLLLKTTGGVDLGASIDRLESFVMQANIVVGTGTGANADGPVTVTITRPDPRSDVDLLLEGETEPAPDNVQTITLDAVSGTPGLYRKEYTAKINDRSGTWSLVAHATIAGASRESPERMVTVEPVSMNMQLLTTSLEYFSTDSISIFARPAPGRFSQGHDDDAEFEILDATGTPVTGDFVSSFSPMSWDDAQKRWFAVFPLTDLVSEDNEGDWQITVNAHDDAFFPNTDTKTGEVLVHSLAGNVLELVTEGPVQRGQPFELIASYTIRGIPENGRTVTLSGTRADTSAFGPIAMTPSGGGLYKAEVPTTITDPTGDWNFRVDLTTTPADPVARSANFEDVLLVATVPINVYTDKFEYTAIDSVDPTATPSPDESKVTDLTEEKCQPVVTGPDLAEFTTLGDVDTTLTEDCAGQAGEEVLRNGVDPFADGGETIEVFAYPLGVAGLDFHNTGGGAPGKANYRVVYLASGAPVDLAGQPMQWVPDSNPLHPGGVFRATHRLAGQSLVSGGWSVIVDYSDDAVAPNVGVGDATIIVRSNFVDAAPPAARLTTFNGASVPVERIVTSGAGVWNLEGTYKSGSSGSAPPVQHVWVRVLGGEWMAAALTPPSGLSGTWTATITSETEAALHAKGRLAVEVVAAYDPGCPSECLFETPDDAVTLATESVLSPVFRLLVDFQPQDQPVLIVDGLLRDGQQATGGAVLYDGSRHTLTGRVEKHGSTITELHVKVNRVVWANCVDPDFVDKQGHAKQDFDNDPNDVHVHQRFDTDTFADNDDAKEWCLREAVSDIDVLSPAFAGNPAVRIDQTTTPGVIRWELDWDVAQPAFRLGSETDLTRRVNSEYEKPGAVAGKGETGADLGHVLRRPYGSTAWTQIPEVLEDQSDLIPWEYNGKDPLSYLDESRYWLTTKVVTSDAFTLENKMPNTAQSLAGKLCASTQIGPTLSGDIEFDFGQIPGVPAHRDFLDGRCAKGPAPNAGDGRYAGFTGLELRYAGIPSSTIDSVHTQVAAAPLTSGWAAKGSDLFNLTHMNADNAAANRILLNGTLSNNGNDIQRVEIAVYRAVNANCVKSGPSWGDNAAVEWCLDPLQRVLVSPSAFSPTYNPSHLAVAAQKFTVAIPAPSGGWDQTKMYWFAVSVITEDGDRYEDVPGAPVLDNKFVSGTNPTSAVKNPTDPTSLMVSGQEPLSAADDRYAPAIRDYANGFGSTLALVKGTIAGFPGAAQLVAHRPFLNISHLRDLTKSRATDVAAYIPFTYVTANPAKALDTPGGKAIGNLMNGRIRVNGTFHDKDVLSDVQELRFNFTYDVGPNCGADPCVARGEVDVPVDVTHGASGQPAGDSWFGVNRTTIGGKLVTGQLLTNGQFDVSIDTKMILDTIGVEAHNAQRIFGAGAARLSMSVTLVGASGFTTTHTFKLGVDQNSAPTSKVTRIRETSFNETTQALQMRDLDLNSPLVKWVRSDGTQFNVTGNFVPTIEMTDPQGLDLQAPLNSYGNGKLVFAEFAVGKQSPPIEWRFWGDDTNFGPYNDLIRSTGLDQLGFDRNGKIDFVKMSPVPLSVQCPFPAGSGASCTGTVPANQGGWSDTDPNLYTFNHVEAFLVPIRVGFNPAFVQVQGDPWDPNTWTTAQVDLTDQETQLDVFTPANQKYLYRDECGLVVVTGPVPLTSTLQDCRDTSQPSKIQTFYYGTLVDLDGTQDTGGAIIGSSGAPAENQNFFLSSGDFGYRNPYGAFAVDDGCGLDENQQAQTGACTPSTFLPFEQDGSANGIRGTDDWGRCTDREIEYNMAEAQQFPSDQGNTRPADDTCDPNTRWDDVKSGNPDAAPDPDSPLYQCITGCYSDETIEEAFFLVSRNLPIAYYGPQNPASPVCSDPNPNDSNFADCWAKNFKAGDGTTDYKGPSQFMIPRGFEWLSNKTTPGIADPQMTPIVAVNPTTATLDFTRFATAQNLNLASPTFGVSQYADAMYTLTMRGVDNVATMSDRVNSNVRNDDGPTTTFIFNLVNDKDKDGVASAREQLLRQKIRDGRMRQALDPNQGDADRYFDPTSPYPDWQDSASTENDWDGDGAANTMRQAVGPVFDLERLLNLDPLVPDRTDTTPGLGCVPGQPGHSTGLLGDRDHDCVPNGADPDKQIFRSLDTDSDGYADAAEDTNHNGEFDGCTGAGADDSDFENPSSRPGDCNANGIPDGPDPFISGLVSGLTGGNGCAKAATAACPHAVQANLTGNPGGFRYVFLDATSNGAASKFALGYRDATGEHVVVSDQSAASAVSMARALVNATACSTANGGASRCGHLLQFNLTAAGPMGVGGIRYVYVDAKADGANSNFSVGVRDTTEHEVLGRMTLEQAVKGALAAASLAGCAKAATPKCTHTIQANVTQTNPMGIKHVYADQQTDGVVIVGFHDGTGDKPLASSKTVSDSVAVIMAVVMGAIVTAMDTDGDHYSTDEELRSQTNPFNRDSRPDGVHKGGGFPLDLDGDNYSNDEELRRSSDPMKACSTPGNAQGGFTSNCREGPF